MATGRAAVQTGVHRTRRCPVRARFRRCNELRGLSAPRDQTLAEQVESGPRTKQEMTMCSSTHARDRHCLQIKLDESSFPACFCRLPESLGDGSQCDACCRGICAQWACDIVCYCCCSSSAQTCGSTLTVRVVGSLDPRERGSGACVSRVAIRCARFLSGCSSMYVCVWHVQSCNSWLDCAVSVSQLGTSKYNQF